MTDEQDLAELVELVEAVKREPARRDCLTELLAERNPLYAARGTNTTVRMRGYVLAAFEEVGLPETALPYVLEELESGRHAYAVAAAAKALRGLDRPTGSVLPFLLKAIHNIRYLDDALSFATGRTTAMEELMKTFAWLGGEARPALSTLEELHADRGSLSERARAILADLLPALRAAPGCCSAPAEPGRKLLPVLRNEAPPLAVEFEDQDGRCLSFQDYFTGRPAVVVFFYTRCDNPNKCSLTVTQLAGLQRALDEEGLRGQVRMAGITYDPGFDVPVRLRAYGENRGVVFDENARFLRTTKGFPVLKEYFALGVSYGPVLVNRHRIELYLLDRDGSIAHESTRLRWDAGEVMAELRRLPRAAR